MSSAQKRKLSDSEQQPEQNRYRKLPVRTIFGRPPVDKLTESIADFVSQALKHRNIEIEVKFGLLVDKATQQRIYLPSVNEIILVDDDNKGFRFVSEISQEQHRRFNELFNKRVEAGRNSSPDNVVYYKHLRETDTFYQTNTSYGRVRVTRNEKNEIVRILRKERLNDMHLHLPWASVDCRISANIETPIDHTVIDDINQSQKQNQDTHARKKDRLCYMHDVFEVDLTQVSSPTEGVKYELEMEIAKNDVVLKEVIRMNDKKESSYIEIIQSLVGNIRQIAKEALWQEK
ncbi:hypothetical protein MP638_004306 [Amoeboaphelidium occidentale]|nr:hypothetical protein MP638_004306 [Amoeboaphelidium occidentale]